jgi:hypothetical protein
MYNSFLLLYSSRSSLYIFSLINIYKFRARDLISIQVLFITWYEPRLGLVFSPSLYMYEFESKALISIQVLFITWYELSLCLIFFSPGPNRHHFPSFAASTAGALFSHHGARLFHHGSRARDFFLHRGLHKTSRLHLYLILSIGYGALFAVMSCVAVVCGPSRRTTCWTIV